MEFIRYIIDAIKYYTSYYISHDNAGYENIKSEDSINTVDDSINSNTDTDTDIDNDVSKKE
jgi:hypothetical protein